VIPVDELRDYVKAKDADEPILEKMELAAVAFVERETGRYFGEPAPIAEVFSGAYAGPLYLSESPAADPALVLEYFDGTSWSTVDSSSYTIDGSAIWPAASTLWIYGHRNYRATYTRGYVAGEEPADIRQAVMDLVATKWKGRGQEGMQSETIGGYQYTRSDAFEVVPGLSDTLRNWRRVRV
jgi:hypothetical protein